MNDRNAVVIADKDTLADQIFELYSNRDRMDQLGLKAKEVLKENKMSLEKTFSAVKQFLER